MITDRKAWTQRLISEDPELGDFLKALHTQFNARVVSCRHSHAGLCWDEPSEEREDWIIPAIPMRVGKRLNQ